MRTFSLNYFFFLFQLISCYLISFALFCTFFYECNFSETFKMFNFVCSFNLSPLIPWLDSLFFLLYLAEHDVLKAKPLEWLDVNSGNKESRKYLDEGREGIALDSTSLACSFEKKKRNLKLVFVRFLVLKFLIRNDFMKWKTICLHFKWQRGKEREEMRREERKESSIKTKNK